MSSKQVSQQLQEQQSPQSQQSQEGFNMMNHQCRRCNNYFNRCRCHNHMYKHWRNSCMCGLMLKVVLFMVLALIMYKLVEFNSKNNVIKF